ncbi:hypothetical protein CDCA_CDCA17G4451 [Cyanidium caldarium]|uniref:Spt4/RpoE2 zinc finger domain-containing protein n=1 Tax=Cyanidium caldarium TaxID=2771 RepID=A0AAV9J1Y6_CYACA|nr:hypothetical protein CDCA_CDCA17G4451 [Cyanidium caldarium]|eukprot:ctg_630.g255
MPLGDADAAAVAEVVRTPVPADMQPAKLRACLSCALVKAVHQFVADGCENCPNLLEPGTGDRERVMAFTTAEFSGLVAMVKPQESWVARWQRSGRLCPGCYALRIDAEIPEDVMEELRSLGTGAPAE